MVVMVELQSSPSQTRPQDCGQTTHGRNIEAAGGFSAGKRRKLKAQEAMTTGVPTEYRSPPSGSRRVASLGDCGTRSPVCA